MVPVAFDEANVVFSKPSNMTHEECEPLNVFKGSDGNYDVLISCWKLTQQEVDDLMVTGRIWLWVYSNEHSPVKLSAIKPTFSSDNGIDASS